MHVTTLVENHRANSESKLIAEHGLSLLIEHGARRILFDTGASGAFAANAAQLGIDLGQIDAAVLSHHHFDHGGGLPEFFAANEHARVYLRRPPQGEPAFRALGFIRRDIGLPAELLNRYRQRFVFIDQFTEILPGIYIFTEISRKHARPEGNRYLYLRKPDGLSPDAFDHELVLAIRVENGLVVLTGCSHSGALNMIQTVLERFPQDHIRAVVGGFHLVGLPFFNSMAGSRSEIAAIGQRMQELPVDRYWTGHCTGRKAYGVLQDVLGDRLAAINTGSRIEI